MSAAVRPAEPSRSEQPPAAVAGQARTFAAYILSRRYAYGRSRPESWGFVISAMGNQHWLASSSWGELKRRLVESGAADATIFGARMAWRSYERWRDFRDRPSAAAASMA